MTEKFKLVKNRIVNVKMGQEVIIVDPVNIYDCTLNDGVFVGPFVEIQKNSLIGKRTKIQSHSFICEMVSIGENCFIGHGVMFTNDRFALGGPANGDKKLWKETIIGDKVSIGSNSTILPVKICDNVVVGAGSVVTRDTTESGVYAGNPARKIK